MIIDLKKLEHVKDKSVYNYNFYKKKDCNTDTLLLIKSIDDRNDVFIFVVSDDKEVFLGCSQERGGILDVDLGVWYT